MNDVIVPYQNRIDIATVNRDLSSAFEEKPTDEDHEDSQVRRVTDVYIGRYGNLGYVEINTFRAPQSFDVGGVIEVPGGLFDAMNKTPGMRGYINEVVFRNILPKQEDLDHPSLNGIHLFDKSYFWHPLGYSSVAPLDLVRIIASAEQDVIQFIAQFEQHLDRFISSDKPKPDFQKLLYLGTTKLLESL